MMNIITIYIKIDRDNNNYDLYINGVTIISNKQLGATPSMGENEKFTECQIQTPTSGDSTGNAYAVESLDWQISSFGVYPINSYWSRQTRRKVFTGL